MDKFAAHLQMGYDLSKRGYAIKGTASKLATKVMDKPQSCGDSPSKIAGLAKHLGTAKLDKVAIGNLLEATFNQAAVSDDLRAPDYCGWCHPREALAGPGGTS